MEGFRSRVDTSVMALGQRDPAAFRSGLVDGVAAVGDALGRVARQDAALDAQVAEDDARIVKIERDRARSSTIAERMGAWPDVQVDVQNRLDDLKNSWKPADGDYQAKADAIVTEALQQFRGSLGDDEEVVERFAPLLATFGASTRQGERRWALTTKAKTEAQGVDVLADTLGNGIVGDPTPSRLQAAIASLDPLIDGLDVPADVRSKVRREKTQGFVRSFLDGRLAAGDWAGAREVLTKGAFDGYLDPDQKAQFLRQAENGEQTAAREAELAQARTRDAARDAVKTLEAKVRAGITPTQAEFTAAERGARAAGLDPAELVDLSALSTKAAVNRTYAGKPAGAMRADRDRLSAKAAAGQASETEQIMLSQLNDLVDDADEKEAAVLRDAAGQGVAGKLQVLGAVTGSAEQRYAIAERVEKGLGALTGLGPRAQRAALQGRETRAARPKDFGEREEVDGAAKAILGQRIAGSLGGNYQTVVDTAWDMMANNLAQNGRGGFDANVFRTSLATAMGATLRTDGVMQGGVQAVRGRPVWLPTWQTPGEFDRQLSRSDFSGAVYAGGKAADKEDVLEHYRPTYIGDDADGRPLYHMVDENGGALMAKDGSAFLLRPRRAR